MDNVELAPLCIACATRTTLAIVAESAKYFNLLPELSSIGMGRAGAVFLTVNKRRGLIAKPRISAKKAAHARLFLKSRKVAEKRRRIERVYDRECQELVDCCRTAFPHLINPLERHATCPNQLCHECNRPDRPEHYCLRDHAFRMEAMREAQGQHQHRVSNVLYQAIFDHEDGQTKAKN